VANKGFAVQLFLKAVNGENGQYTQKRDIFTGKSHFFTCLSLTFNAKHFLTENVVIAITLLSKQRCYPGDDICNSNTRCTGGFMSKQGIRALVYVSLVSAMIWGATGYLLVTAVHVL
jgi:hypothetical protein